MVMGSGGWVSGPHQRVPQRKKPLPERFRVLQRLHNLLFRQTVPQSGGFDGRLKIGKDRQRIVDPGEIVSRGQTRVSVGDLRWDPPRRDASG
jgi:hypothetical protein